VDYVEAVEAYKRCRARLPELEELVAEAASEFCDGKLQEFVRKYGPGSQVAGTMLTFHILDYVVTVDQLLKAVDRLMAERDL
jgi:hypothetical protein